MMSLFYTGRFHTFSPVTYMSRKELHIIRPLIYSTESEIIEETHSQNLTIVKNPCPADKNSGRSQIKNYISDIQKEIPDVKSSIFRAIRSSGTDGWK
jgi:tRNA(Ile)-lysidine synthase TilS/MesJ